MRYLDFLDTVKSAHGPPEPNESEWWRPSLVEQQCAIEVARADLMIRLLHGEDVALSQSQAFDSVALLAAAEVLRELKTSPLSVGFFQLPAEANSLIVASVKAFSNEKFILSAWPGLEPRQRKQVVENLNKGKQPGNMFDDTGIDPLLQDILLPQADALQTLYDYLNDKPSRCATAVPSAESLWNLVKSARDVEHGVPSIVIQAFQRNVDEPRRNDRSALYAALKEIDINSQEKLVVRQHIDNAYNAVVQSSVAGGRGVRTVASLKGDLAPSDLDGIAAAADRPFDPGGVEAHIDVKVELKEVDPMEAAQVQRAGQLDWPKVRDILDTKDFKKSVGRMRSAKPEEVIGARAAHHELLAKMIGWQAESAGLDIIVYLAAAGVGGVVGYFVMGRIEPEYGAIAGAAGTPVATKLAGEHVQKFIKAPYRWWARGRIRKHLEHALKWDSDEKERNHR